ncbi:PREDICTED: receptor-like protein 12 [Nelumbo nucifera]|uniref:Receptor-like protein 12 n=1 Tax=Nelumbo nucifera TaxID=4432 RepID=A0A1U7YQS3_NELNU|nr:PREDICTED: receptor-like protein 12 [Nelumbo nucifera]
MSLGTTAEIMRTFYVVGWALLIIYLLSRVSVCHGAATGCSESDRKALIDFRSGIVDPEGRLHSWQGSECCQWSGVRCDNKTGAGKLPNPLNLIHGVGVDFSSNLLEGPIPLPAVEIVSLDLSNNRFSGSIPPDIGFVVPNLIFLSLSNNHLTGNIPTSIGNMLLLEVLSLSGNNLTGNLPASLGNCSSLNALDLRDNHLSGSIPLSWGQLLMLQSLHLGGNGISGELPSSLQNCSSLETLDLGNNKLLGKIPYWIGESLFALRILRLRSNAFSGRIPSQLSNMSSLQVLDLADNNLVGSIPSSLGNLKAMANVQEENQYLLYGGVGGIVIYYEESLDLSMKGLLLTYSKTLSLVTCIDLSENNLYGDFPESITNLSGLMVLNLSRNHFTGKIPETIASLHELSSLDVSNNQLSGSIPSIMSTMASLSYLNLSNNNLSGSIPFKGQLTTFDMYSYTGNPGLCGDPLPVKCDEGEDSNKQTTVERNGGNIVNSNWFYSGIGTGFAAGLLVPFLVLAMKRSWSNSYFSLVDKIVYRIWDK